MRAGLGPAPATEPGAVSLIVRAPLKRGLSPSKAVTGGFSPPVGAAKRDGGRNPPSRLRRAASLFKGGFGGRRGMAQASLISAQGPPLCGGPWALKCTPRGERRSWTDGHGERRPRRHRPVRAPFHNLKFTCQTNAAKCPVARKEMNGPLAISKSGCRIQAQDIGMSWI